MGTEGEQSLLCDTSTSGARVHAMGRGELRGGSTRLYNFSGGGGERKEKGDGKTQERLNLVAPGNCWGEGDGGGGLGPSTYRLLAVNTGGGSVVLCLTSKKKSNS